MYICIYIYEYMYIYIGFRIQGSQFKNHCSAEMWSGSEQGLYLRLIEWCITQF